MDVHCVNGHGEDCRIRKLKTGKCIFFVFRCEGLKQMPQIKREKYMIKCTMIQQNCSGFTQ